MISYIVPTRNRPETLQRTIHALVDLHHHSACEAEVLVIDNASDSPPQLPSASDRRLRFRAIHLDANMGAAARNVGAQQAVGDWLIMLDDDSHPLDVEFADVLKHASNDVAAIGADIKLPDGSRERGGLPEVIIGCGAAIRRQAFLDVGGYDPAFDYYAEEYDLCAKLIMRGWRVVHDQRFRVLHEKITAGRDFNRILARLVRNSAWVAQRYAPDEELHRELSEITTRYSAISIKERVACGFAQAMEETLRTLQLQPRTPMARDQWDRFTGLAHVRKTFRTQRARIAGATVAIVETGKNEWAVRQALVECGAMIVADASQAKFAAIGTLSPGPMLDALQTALVAGRPVLAGWQPVSANGVSSANHCTAAAA